MILIDINRRVFTWTVSSLVGVHLMLVSWCWTEAIVLSLPCGVVIEDFLGEETTSSDINFLLDDGLVSSESPILNVSEHTFHTSSVLLVLRVLVLVWILNSLQVLLMLVQVVLVHLLLELDVLLVNPVDLLSQLIILPLQSTQVLRLLFHFSIFIIHQVSLDLKLTAKSHELLSLWNDLQ